MPEIKRVGVVSVATFFMMIPTALAAIFGLPLLVLEALIPGSGVLSYIAVVAAALIGGFLAGAISAVLYNVIAGISGGITVELQATGSSEDSTGYGDAETWG